MQQSQKCHHQRLCMLTSELAVHMLKYIVRGYVCCPNIHDSSFIHSFIHSFIYSFIHQEPIFEYIGHVCRYPNTTLTKGMLLVKSRRLYKRDPSKSHSTAQNTGHRFPWINIAKSLHVSMGQAKWATQDKSGFAALVDRVVTTATPC